MKVLVACEFSGTVRDAFIRRGHDAMSCDLLPTEAPGPHYEGSVLDILDDGWDMMIAHPPCRYLTIAGAAYYNTNGRKEKRNEAVEFFQKLINAPVDKIAIENPVPFRSVTAQVGRYHQTINPFEFGEEHRKRICLWLKGLGPLFATEIVTIEPLKIYTRKTGKRAGKSYKTYYHQGKNAKERARFFPGIANAMAEQWG